MLLKAQPLLDAASRASRTPAQLMSTGVPSGTRL
jgi:hypothetical protein